MIHFRLNPGSVDDYQLFLKAKRLPRYQVHGRVVSVPDEYAATLGLPSPTDDASDYRPAAHLFDYQRHTAALAIRKRKLAAFLDCGLGKTSIMLEFARHAAGELKASGRVVLIVSPLMVVRQTMAEAERFYGDTLPIERIPSNRLAEWTANPTASIGITNYDAMSADVPQGRIGALILDESSMLKSHYGKWGQECLRLGSGLEWKLCLTGTPAPNDRIEYANHAVFLDAFPTVNAFLARFFVNRGQTNERWELKPHALAPFYRALSHWSIFMSRPAIYGWKDNAKPLPPIETHIHDVDLTGEQHTAVARETNALFPGVVVGGITSRSRLARIAKGRDADGSKLPTHKYDYIKSLVDSWPSESTIIWCRFNDEQDRVAAMFPGCANIDGSTKPTTREELIDDFKSGRRKVMVSKPKILGFGLNLQVATRQVFSTLQDSYEEFYQCVKRSNRFGSPGPLHVHIPVTEVERPMIETVLRKAAMVQRDTEEQERIFMENANAS